MPSIAVGGAAASSRGTSTAPTPAGVSAGVLEFGPRRQPSATAVRRPEVSTTLPLHAFDSGLASDEYGTFRAGT